MDIFQMIRTNNEAGFLSIIDKIDINIINNNKNLLHEAIVYRNTRIGIELIKRKINVNFQDENGQTPLHYAAAYNSIDLATEILKNGGDLSIKDKYGNNPVWTAIFNVKGVNYNIAELYLENKGDAFSKNKNNMSPYDFAVQINDKKLIAIIKK